MKLSIALVTAIISAVTAFPFDPLSNISPAERSVDLFKRDCASGFSAPLPAKDSADAIKARG
jgi:hypothetical protein